MQKSIAGDVSLKSGNFVFSRRRHKIFSGKKGKTRKDRKFTEGRNLLEDPYNILPFTKYWWYQIGSCF